jgi:hypothetical protein
MTDREKEIDLGVSWPYEAIPTGECIVNQEIFVNLGYKVGDIITVAAHAEYMVQTLAEEYN